MAQNLVLRANSETSLAELEAFVKEAKAYGMPSKTKVPITTKREPHKKTEVTLIVRLPDDARVVNGKKVKVAAKTAKQKRVDSHVKEHSGNHEGYVPPEGRKTAPKPKRIKCPVCNIRKPLVTVSGVKVIKPHQSKGEPCAGSGTQPGLTPAPAKKTAAKKPAKKSASKKGKR